MDFVPIQRIAAGLVAGWLGLGAVCAQTLYASYAPGSALDTGSIQRTAQNSPASSAGPEARLIDIYRLIGNDQVKPAVQAAESLTRDYPNFQLAHLVYGDLLTMLARPVLDFGDVPMAMEQNNSAQQALSDLKQESLARLKALRERPPAGAVPSQFLGLSPLNKHAIAVDASRSRLYLFENNGQQLRLMADFYISVGKMGIDKKVEGDARTPLGVYFIVNSVEGKSLSDFYGSGALPINYPNVLDARRGKTGRGIWLHGTPSSQYSRPPQASDGCVVLSNPDLKFVMRAVEPRTTPVLISPHLEWVTSGTAQNERKSFEDTLHAWQQTKSSGDLVRMLSFYTSDFNSYGKSLTEWTPALRAELDRNRGRSVQLRDLSMLRWTDSVDTMVVTFGEVADGMRSVTKRQYWIRQGSSWKIFFEGAV